MKRVVSKFVTMAAVFVAMTSIAAAQAVQAAVAPRAVSIGPLQAALAAQGVYLQGR